MYTEPLVEAKEYGADWEYTFQRSFGGERE
jgi:hypothetical protein